MTKIAVVGTIAVLLHACTVVLLLSRAGSSVEPEIRAALAIGSLVLSVMITTAAVWREWARRNASSEQHGDAHGMLERPDRIVERDCRLLEEAHRMLDQATAFLEENPGAADRRATASLDALVARLGRHVQRVEQVVEERHDRERELMRADQLAMVGQMAAGVAHEIRNPLTSIKMLVQAGRKEESPALTDDDLSIIEHEIRRLERSLQRFLDFARPPHPERRPLNLAPLIERTLALVEGRARKQNVEVRCELREEAVIADVDGDQIQQLLLNLLLNSLDVMPDGGRLRVELAALPTGEAEIRVSDSGPGIPAELLPRLFDPFMSTKETGIGLGLAVSHRIAERHGGTLSAHNAPGGGACFVLRVALATETSDVAQPGSSE